MATKATSATKSGAKRASARNATKKTVGTATAGASKGAAAKTTTTNASATRKAASKTGATKAAAAKTVAKKAVAKKGNAKKSNAKKLAAKSTQVPAREPSKRPIAKRAKTAVASQGDPLARIRTICLAFPEAHEVEAWGEPTFRVKNKIFAMHSSASTHHGGGRQGIWINSDHVTQDLLLRAKPERYFKPPYVGPSGWVGAWLDGKPDWAEIAELLRDGYRKRAPAKVAALLDEE